LDGPGDLLYMQAFDEGGAQVAQVDGDNTSRRFGLPLYYNLVVPTGEVGGQRQMRAHWTRCIHVAEGVDNNPLLGTPRLEACWNRLVDILKIMAGAGEAAWKLLNAGHILTTQEGKRLPTSETALADLEDQIEEFVHGLRRWLLTEGLEATQIGGSISDPTGLVMANVALISAATGIPQRILLGSERGELASSQDEDNWAKQIETRQRLHAEAMIVRPFIQRLIWAGVLPRPETGAVTVAWQKLRKEDKQRAAGVKRSSCRPRTKAEAAKTKVALPHTHHRQRRLQSNPRAYHRVNRSRSASIARPTREEWPTSKNCEQRMGARVRASSRDRTTATESVTPNWKKNFPMIPFMKTTGTKMAKMATVAARAAKVISRAPTMAALMRESPLSR
jgi:hypothetical protein